MSWGSEGISLVEVQYQRHLDKFCNKCSYLYFFVLKVSKNKYRIFYSDVCSKYSCISTTKKQFVPPH